MLSVLSLQQVMHKPLHVGGRTAVELSGYAHYVGAGETPRVYLYGFTVAVIERYAAIAGKHCQEVLGNTRQAPLNRLRRYFEDLIRAAGPSAPIAGCLIGSLSLEVAGASPLLQGCLSTSFAGWQAAIANVLLEAVERGDLPESTRPESLANFILNSWEGALLRSQAENSDAALKDFLNYVFRALLTKDRLR